MTLMKIVDTTGHPGGAPDMPRLPSEHQQRGPFVGLNPRIQTAATERAIYLRQADSAVWTSDRLGQDDLSLSADTVIAYPAGWRGDSASWEAVLLVANGFTLVPA